MQILKRGGDEGQVFVRIGQGSFQACELALHLGLRHFLLGNAFCVCCTCRLRVLHELCIIVLRSLLLVFCILHVALKLLHHHVHEANHASTLLVLLHLSAESLGGLRRCNIRLVLVPCVTVDLREATSLHDLVLHAHLLLRRSFVKCWIVELLEPILGFANQLDRCLAQLSCLKIHGVFLLALLGGLRHRFVQ